MAALDLQDHLVHPDSVVHLVCQEPLVCLDSQESRDTSENEDSVDHLERKEAAEKADVQDSVAFPVHEDHSVNQEAQALMARMVLEVPLVKTGFPVHLAHQDQEVYLEVRGPLEQRVIADRQEEMETQDSMA